MAIHERLREIREQTGLTQKGFAQSMGMEQSKYNKWENGKNAPDYEALCQLADKLEVTTDYLLGRTDATKAEQIDTIEYTGLSANAVDRLHRMKNDYAHGDCMLRSINFLIEYNHGTPFLLDLYHYLFSTFAFGNPHKSPIEMENDEHYVTTSNFAAYTEELRGYKVNLTHRDINKIYLTKVHEDIILMKELIQEENARDMKFERLEE